MPSIMPIYGTRPEAIKMAPLIAAMQASPDLDVQVTLTGQHRGMLDQVNELFGIAGTFDLDLMNRSAGLSDLSARILTGLDALLREAAPDAVVVQGDTTSSTMAAIAAYYARIPVIHLEAGLRSGDLHSPYPEEGNRKITGQLAELHLAPTISAKANLLAEGVPAERIVVTGNTVIDALLAVVQRQTTFEDERITAAVASGDPILLVTSHRRESWETGIAATARAVRELVARHPSLRVVLPQHGNPLVREALAQGLPDDPRVILTEPLDYGQFTHLLSRCHLVLTDSGGVQEEAPSLGKPVLVTRDTTERPEAVTAGVVRLVGTDQQRIVSEVSRLLDDAEAYAAMSSAVNPYGDGRASERALAAVREFFGIGSRLADFTG